MQNIPGIALEKAQEQLKTVRISSVKKDEQQQLFADLFDQHSSKVEKELALSPVETKDKMLDTAPVASNEKESTANATNIEAPPKEETPEEDAMHGREERMTKEEFEEVRDDLEEYGMSEEEIAELEERVESEEGLTWGQFVSVVAHKMSDMKKVSLTDQQKNELNSFFAKFGFTSKQSAKLIGQLENGEHDKVMQALQAKLDAMPQNKNLMIRKGEIEAFSAAMNFSKEFTSKLKEMFGQNTLGKDVKEAFTMIRQELAQMDAKDEKLVMAVGKTFAAAMGKQVKESTAAKDIKEAVDLKPRVGEEDAKAQLKEDFKEAVSDRKDAMTDAQSKKTDQKAVPQKSETDPDAAEQQAENDTDESWNNFFGKLKDDSGQGTDNPLLFKPKTTDQTTKTGLAEAMNVSKDSGKNWEKVSAPKVMRQVDDAFIKTLSNGTKQLTVQLTPENLGKLNIMLQVNGKEVNAVIRAESADAAKIIAENIDQIKSSLENQGLKVEKLEVQTGMTGGQGDRNWFGQEEHNLAREREVMTAMRNHMKAMRGENAEVAQDVQSRVRQAIHADHGLYVIA